MRISRLSVQNFRSLKDVSLDCGPVVTLVGRNGAGKSGFLQALDLFYRPNSIVTAEDFYGRDISVPMRISLEFGDLRADELAAFSPYIYNGRLAVTKRFATDDPTVPVQGKYYARRHRYQPFVVIEGMDKAAARKPALNAEIERLIAAGTLPPATPKPKNAEQVAEFMASFEVAHADMTAPVESETQFFGEKSVGGGKLDHFTQFVYVPAVRDVQQDTVEKKASFSQLLDLVVLRKVNLRPEVMSLNAELQGKVAAVFDGGALNADLAQLEGDLNKALKPFVPNAALSLGIGAPATASYNMPVVVPLVSEDNFKGEIAKKGHGLQRAIILTLLTQLQRAKNASQGSGHPGAAGGTGGPEPDLILGIEEPELYQHPSRCRHFAQVLRALADAGGAQVFQTTHSPQFVSLDHFDEVRSIQKRPGGGAGPASSFVSHVAVETLREHWAEHCGRPKDEVSVASLMARVSRSMTGAVSEGFFADAVVLVEGFGEVGILNRLADRLGKEWQAKGIAVLPVNGKKNLGAPTLIFRLLGMPTYFVFDGDDGHKGKNDKTEKSTAAQNRALLRLGGATEEAFPQDRIEANFACFGGNLEKHCRQAIGEDYVAITREISEDIGWESPDEVMKNTRGSEDFVNRAYEKGKALVFLEKLVDAITKLTTG